MQNGVDFPENILGAPDGNGAELFTNNDNIGIDLIHTIPSGGQYSITWRKRAGEGPDDSRLVLYESPDGITITEHPLSVSRSITTSSVTYVTVVITANVDTRYIGITKLDPYPIDFLIDAITFDEDVCLIDPSCNPVSTEHLISGFVYSVVGQNSIVNAASSIGAPDGVGAELDDSGDWLEVRLR